MEDPVSSDHQLIIDAQSGDFEAFRMIVLHYSNAMLSVAYSVLGDFYEAQDVAQEVFVKCYKSLPTLKDPSRLGSWLYSIAHRTSLDFVKKKKASVHYDETNAPQTDNVNEWLDRHVIQEAVWKALQTLEGKSKSAIVLYYLSDWSMKEIAHFLDLSLSAVESRIRRARETLKVYLADDFESFFRSQRLGRDFEQMVCEQLLKRMGHFYIPVINKKQTTEWFVRHFHLGISIHGNLLLESGHELYLLESETRSPKGMPVLTFSVEDADELWLQLTSGRVDSGPIETHELFGKQFVFYDPDGNKYQVVENK
ncbi:RNA polymerase subunit sigma-24 [Paenibacillus beijingensis]|uniref:RNA polymerase subunit sigma-24 n=1 Tax=Paenibacillus beijingensis TaxID=1126833 RepID=A0A0D5NQR9_9BACL|nr:RNA polymerase subunit sigma-24 [Paenibacillus beijingensis]